jgi:general secretion pathway protein D
LKFRSVGVPLILLALLALAGCTSQPTRDFRDGKDKFSGGQIEQGLAQLEQATKADPENVEYRQYFFKQRESAVNQLLGKADVERAKEAFDEAASDYKRVQKIDPNNQRARDGLSLLQGDRERKQILADALVLFNQGDLDGATAKVQTILTENPLQQEAKALQKQIDEKIAEYRETTESTFIKKANKKSISLEFQDASLKAVFNVVARVSGINFVFDKDIKPELKITILVKDMMIEDALKLLLVTNQLQKEVINENTIIIYPDTAAKIKDYQQQVVRSFYLANADVKKTLEMVKTILRVKDVFVDERRNMLILRDTPEVIRLAEKLIDAQDVADPEVELEVEILEINASHLNNLGLGFPQQISASLGTAGSFTQNQAQNRNSSFTTYKITDPAFTLNMQKVDSDTTLLANPRIRVKDREKANIHIGQRLPVLTTVSTAGVGSAESVSYIDVGLKLDVEPSIRLDDQVDMKVKLEVSSVNQTITLASGTQVYQLGTRNADTVLRLKDGETQVLAGLIQKDDSSTVNKLPGFGNIPLFGRLFSNDNSNKQKTDLVLLITPHVVRNVTRPDKMATQFASGTDSAIGSAPKAKQMLPVVVKVVPATPVKSNDVVSSEPVTLSNNFKPVNPLEASKQESKLDQSSAATVAQ